MELVKVTNGVYPDERALMNLITDKVYAKGDGGQGNIDRYITGILKGFEILEEEFTCREVVVLPGDYLFDACEFYYEEE